MSKHLVTNLARRVFPEFDQLARVDQQEIIGNLLSLLYGIPLSLLGVGWLIAVTDWAEIVAGWPFFVLNLILLFVFDLFAFFTIDEIYPGIYLDWQASFKNIVVWAVALIHGPEALWIPVLYLVIFYGLRWRRTAAQRRLHALLRNFTFNLTVQAPGTLIALRLYQRWGGSFPLPNLGLDALLPAVVATLFECAFLAFVWLPYFIYTWKAAQRIQDQKLPPPLQFWVATLGWKFISDPFGILAANFYGTSSLSGYLAFVATLLFASVLAHRLSKAVAHSRQRAREMDRLDLLSNALLSMPLSEDSLAEVLEEQTATLFPYSRIEVRIFPEKTLLHAPEDKPHAPENMWQWFKTLEEPRYFPRGRPLPWTDKLSPGIIVTPILDVESDTTLGGVFVARQRVHPETIEPLSNLLPAVQSLTAQIAAALHNIESYEQTLAHERMTQELRVAGKIQASFLPQRLPEIPSWQLAATLRPARETSGDFYDVIPLPNGRFGILIADVADKGTGAALYMALSRTLLRTYALQYHTHPDYVLRVANRRILMDTENDLFVTVFYGVLDPATGEFIYGNAGHMPPYVLRADVKPEPLMRTGMPLGLYGGESWEQDSMTLGAGDVLLLYTDGVTDAENEHGEFFGRQRLVDVAQTQVKSAAPVLQRAVLSEVYAFAGESVQSDDITMMILTHRAADG